LLYNYNVHFPELDRQQKWILRTLRDLCALRRKGVSHTRLARDFVE
jgi:hypothetical protein